MKRHDDAPGWRKRSDRFAVTRPVHHTPPLYLFHSRLRLLLEPPPSAVISSRFKPRNN